jgi:hypothetical protein
MREGLISRIGQPKREFTLGLSGRISGWGKLHAERSTNIRTITARNKIRGSH